MTSRRLDAILWSLAGLFLAVAAVALAWERPLPERMILPAELDTGGASEVMLKERNDPRSQVVATNIFSVSRMPPAERYQPYTEEFTPVDIDPYGFGLDSYSPDGYAPSPDGSLEQSPFPEVTVGTEPVPHVYGTVVRQGGSSAVMRLDEAQPAPRIYREGDQGGAYTVVSINSRSVVLDGPDGRIEVPLLSPNER